MMQTWIRKKRLSTYVFQDRLYVTITLLWHSTKHGSKSQATLCRGLQVQLQSLTDHPRASSENLMISTSIMVTEVTNWQIAGSFAILWRISNWYKYNTTEMMLWQKATYFQNTAIWGHLYVVKNFTGWCNNFLQLDCQVLFSVAIRIFRVRTDVWKCLVSETFDSAK